MVMRGSVTRVKNRSSPLKGLEFILTTRSSDKDRTWEGEATSESDSASLLILLFQV